MTLSPRLAAIACLIPPGSRVADVGTDHGYLPAWLRREEICPFVIATDIAPSPLETARGTAAGWGVDTGIAFRLANGLDAVSPDEIDLAVIAGMGGETIAGILAAAPWLTAGSHRLILQPQSKFPELMDALAGEGFCVIDQHLVEEVGRIYTILEAIPGTMSTPTGAKRYVNQTLLERGDLLLFAYLTEQCNKLRRALRGLEQSAGEAKKRIEFQHALAELEQWNCLVGRGDPPRRF